MDSSSVHSIRVSSNTTLHPNDAFRRYVNEPLPEGYVPPDRSEYPALWHHHIRDERNMIKTTSLFFESRKDRDLTALWTLKSRPLVVDGVVYPSLKQIYLSYDHTPGNEYEFALDVFGSWDAWVKLTKSAVREHIQDWRDEIEVKLKAEAIKSMIVAARTDDSKGVAAAKWLADKGYAPKRTAGRPSVEEIKREVKQQAEVNRDLSEDMARLGLHVIGGK